jgi:leucyl aminopeptidase
MTDKTFSFPDTFVKSTKKPIIPVYFLTKKTLPDWLKKQNASTKSQIKLRGFEASPKQICKIINSKGEIACFVSGISQDTNYQESATLAQSIQNNFDESLISQNIFSIESTHERIALEKLCLGWGLSAYKFDHYKANNTKPPILIWPSDIDIKFVNVQLRATFLLRNLINTPANYLGTDELAEVAKQVAKTHKAKVKIIKDQELIKKNFPMIYTVGKASPRRPQLVEITWGNPKHPKVTIVGKGIIYDTGGLNLKPPQAMRQMKKDMGGAAHALGVAWVIMALNMPIQLRILLPIAENSVAGNAFRPGDIYPTRKGLSVEIDDTDAEGRLVLADALTYACEEEPDLLIDFATLTGAARVGIGYDIPAFFSNRDEFNDTLRHSSKDIDDFVWPFPLWEGYENNVKNDISDLVSVGSGRAGHIEAALFLQNFITPKTDWIHLDCYAWEQNGKPGRPKGGADTGMRAIVDFIKTRYNP